MRTGVLDVDITVVCYWLNNRIIFFTPQVREYVTQRRAIVIIFIIACDIQCTIVCRVHNASCQTCVDPCDPKRPVSRSERLWILLRTRFRCWLSNLLSRGSLHGLVETRVPIMPLILLWDSKIIGDLTGPGREVVILLLTGDTGWWSYFTSQNFMMEQPS